MDRHAFVDGYDPDRVAKLDRLGDEIAELSAHLEAATARLLDLIREFALPAARGALFGFPYDDQSCNCQRSTARLLVGRAGTGDADGAGAGGGPGARVDGGVTAARSLGPPGCFPRASAIVLRL